MTVKVTDNLSIDVRPTSNKKYDIITIRGNRETILFSSDKPITSYSKQNSGKKVIQYLEKKLKLYEVEKIMEEQQVPRGIALEEFKDEYIQNILSELERIRGLRCGNFKEQLEVANDEAIAIEEVEQLIMMGRKYPPLFQHFQSRCTEFNFTPLEFIAKVTEGLGVGLTIEVLRAFFGFLQTYLGYKGTNVIAVGSQASGKALALNTMLPTPNGFTTISNVQIGDELFDEQGKVCKVIAKSPIWNTDCYRITFDHYDEVIASGNHIWTVTDLNARSKHKEPFQITTSEIFQQGIRNKNGGSPTWEFKIQNPSPLQLEEKELLIDPYILGCWLGDGDSENGCICNKDEEVINAFQEKYELTDLHKSRKNLHYYVKGLITELRRLNLLNNKHIPLDYLRSSYSQRLRLLQGLMDTDGTISKSGKCTITQKNYELISNIRELLLSLGIKCTITETEKCATNTKDKIKRIYFNIHFVTTLPVFTIKRKLERLPNKVQPSSLTRIITNIEKIESVPTQCIQVDSESSMFLCDNFIPTRNSHILETALKFIPQERVHYGVKSVAYFFRKYNHMDLTGHIFMLGDLGGDHDGEDTIRMRDLLKQLTTDGYVERGIVDNQNDNVAEEQWVKGYPCLAYTTAHEEIINEQEKSRSIIITPPFIDGRDLMTFKAIMNNQGSYKYELEKVDKDCKSIQGFVHYMSMTKNDVDIFNVYLYDIVDYIGNIDDFNRKIDEFNSILKLSCILNKARTIYHTQYDGLECPLILVGKQDIRTALTIFDNNNNLLPNEVKLVNGIFKNFKPYNVGKCKSNTAYEDAVKFEVGTLEGSNDADWLSCNIDKDGQYFFTERYLKTECGRQRWYRNNHENMTFKLQKLYDQNYLIQVGTDNNNPVYGVNGFLYDGSPVNRIEPSFNEKNLCQGKELFEQNYTDCVGEMEDFIKSNKGINKNSELFFEKLLKEEHIYKLGWLK